MGFQEIPGPFYFNASHSFAGVSESSRGFSGYSKGFQGDALRFHEFFRGFQRVSGVVWVSQERFRSSYEAFQGIIIGFTGRLNVSAAFRERFRSTPGEKMLVLHFGLGVPVVPN